MPHHFAVWLLRALFTGMVMAALYGFVRRWPGSGDGGRPA